MSAKLLTEHQLEFLRLKGGCTGSSVSTLVKMPHCWKSHVTAHICMYIQSKTLCMCYTHKKCHFEVVITFVFVLIHIRKKDEVGPPTCLSPPVTFLLTVPRRCFLCGSFFVICVSCLSCRLVCSLHHCGHLLGKG